MLHGGERLESRQLLALTVANLPAQDITFDSATVGIEIVESTNGEPTVSIYWGDEDGGTDIRGWDNVENLGFRSLGQHTTTLDNLMHGTEYFYRSFAFSLADAEQTWSTEAARFTTESLPAARATLQTTPVIGESSAVLTGSIEGDGSLESAAIYFGQSDGGEDPASWDNSFGFAVEEGDFSTLLPGLSPNTTYQLRLAATNANGTGWSNVQSITTAEVTSPLRISEVMGANASNLITRVRLHEDDSFAGPTNAYDWIEIQNTTSQVFDLSGYFLSDSEELPQKWQVPAETTIPANGAIVILASGKDVVDPQLDEQGKLHANFSIDNDGETLSLTAPDGVLVHQLAAESLVFQPDVSRGYFGNTFGVLAAPSPGTSNGPVGADISTPNHVFANPEDMSSELIVTTQITRPDRETLDVSLSYRAMFAEELSIPMTDDGSGADQVAGDGIYTASIPANTAQPGEMLRYFVSVTDQFDIETRMPRFLSDDGSPEYFGTMIEDASIDSQIPVLHRFIENERRAETGSGTRASVYFNGEFYDNVFIRIRGGTARSWPKKAYKIEFNDEYHFRFREDLPRVDEFNLNTTYTDKSYVRAILSYELYRDSGGIAPITFPMRVEQNGEFWNVSHFVEQPDRDYLRHNGLDPNGALYKARADRLNGLTGRAQGFFDKKTRHAEDASDLQELIDGLATSGEELETYLFDNVDLPAQINLMANNLILQNLDATDKNYYIYRDTEGNQEWKMLPWDLDLVLGPNALNTDNFSTSDDTRPAHTSHPYMGTLAYPFHGRKNHLFDAIVNTPRTNEMFLRRVRSMMDQFMASEETPIEQRYFENRIDELAALIRPDSLLDKEKWDRQTHFPGRTYTIEEAGDRIKTDYLIPRRVHLFDTHNISQLEQSEIKVIIPEFVEGAQFIVPTDNSLGTTWTEIAPPANIDQWQTGQSGIGFENSPGDYVDLIKSRIKPLDACDTCTSIYTRIPFSVEDAAAIEHLTLRMKYDDGFVAYINGVEVARANTREDVNGFDSRGRAHPDRDAVQFENFNVTSSLSEIGLGAENVLAVHLMNTSVSSNDMILSLELVDGFIPNTNAVGIPHEQSAQPNMAFVSFDQNPVSGNQDEEFVELKNEGDEAFDISGWQLRGGISHHFRGGTVINAGESLFITPDSLAFRNRATGPTGGMGLFVQDGYEGHLSSRGETVELIDSNDNVVASLTTPDTASDTQNLLRITEVHYNPASADDSTEFIELRNISHTTTLDLNGVSLADGPSEPFEFTGSNVTSLEPGGYVLVVGDLESFAAAYPNVDATIIAGQFTGRLSNGGETIKLEDAQNSTILEFRYEDGSDPDEEDWHPSTDGDGFSLVVVNENGSPDDWDTGAGWRPSFALGGSPGASETSLVDADFDGDGDVDADDIDLLTEGIQQADLRFDLNQDGTTDQSDRNLLITQQLNTNLGDSNLDGVFNSADLVIVFTAGVYEDSIPNNAGWAEGDWNGDGEFTTADLVAAFQTDSYVAEASFSVAPRRLDWFDTIQRRRHERSVDSVWANDDIFLSEYGNDI